MDPLGTLMKRQRHDHNLSLRDVAEDLGVGVAAVSSWENGRRRPTPNEASYGVLLHAYRIDKAALLQAFNALWDLPILEFREPIGPAFVSYAHQEGNADCPCNECRFAEGDPTNPDGSCAHDYLCAYCSQPATK